MAPHVSSDASAFPASGLRLRVYILFCTLRTMVVVRHCLAYAM